MRPLVIVRNSPATVEERVAELAGEGWLVRRSWTLPWATWDADRSRVVCTGEIAGGEDAAAALLAAARGAGVVVDANGDGDLVERFYEDLCRFGPVDYVCPPRTTSESSELDEEQRRLLELLGEGLRLGDAARELHISRRTADRRLAAARRALGVRTTAEAVVLVAGGRGPLS
jgi:DNA-binding NarL/FixJ family response regulator